MSGAAGQEHDPHEVTVQLDAVQLGDGVLRKAPDGPIPAATADRPVFVDESGRRGRLYRRMGITVGLACAVYAVVMVVTLLSGTSDAPWLPVPGQEKGKPAGQVDTTEPPTGSASPSDTGSPSPGTSPSATGVEEQLPDTGALVTRTAPATEQSVTAPDPSPTGTATTPAQGTATEPDPTGTAGEPGTGSPAPTGTGDDDPTADPTGTAGGDDGTGTGDDSGNLAQGPGATSPLAAAATPGAPVPDSPLVEYTF